MNQRLLKIQLFFFFTLTCVSFSAFYFYDSLPDNYFSISSNTESVSAISYAFFSFIASVGFYLGPWVFVPFILFSLVYTFIYGNRERGWDFFGGPLLYIFIGIFSFYAAPEFVGRGMKYYLDAYITDFALLTSAFICLAAFSFLTFEKAFVKTLYSSVVLILQSPQRVWGALTRLKPIDRMRETIAILNRTFDLTRQRLTSLVNRKVRTPARPAALSIGENAPRVRPVVAREVPEEKFNQEVDEDFEEEQSQSPVPNIKKREPSIEGKSYNDVMSFFSEQSPAEDQQQPDEAYFNEIISRLHNKLEEFKIDGQIINVLKGPVVDTYELELGAGVKVARLNSIQEDLSLALNGAPIRIVYPMKERTTVGIEVPRRPRDIIYLQELLNSKEFTNSRSRLPVAMGKDAFGETFVVDLAAMPHMLVAGSTGAGKSVFINTLLVSLLVKKSPQDLRLILIDPKQLELALYSELPHLVMPVITEAKRATIAFMWAIQEMERRYTILKDTGVRDIESFNKKVRKAEPALLSKIHPHYEIDPDEEGYELPYIVIIVDEFADLILSKMGKDIETAIARLAAKARASGIHLVLATQRPSVNVVTGIIKSNFPVRVSFRVTSVIDSRTILDCGGAEKLLGSGDMLYRHGVETTRAHSGYVEEDEIEVLMDKMKEVPGGFNEEAVRYLDSGGESGSDEFGDVSISLGGSITDGDDLYREAVKVVVESKAASASMLQRRLKIGYPRAANLIDELERKGVIGPAQGSKPREVLGGESRA